MTYKQPLSIYFVYHPNDYNNNDNLENSLKFCYKSLQRDTTKPFSRFINIPVFYNTSLDNNIPSPINSQSEKTIVFLLISKYIIADHEWNDYYKSLCNNEKFVTVPVAIDEYAINFGHCSDCNFIRADQFNKKYYNEEFLLNVTHEIYKWSCKNYRCEVGNEQAISIFLSHTKEDKTGEEIALEIKQFIDRTRFKNFFDATDIAINYKFEDEIKAHLKKSTLLAIHSDPYSSRYWCQREILYAKGNNIPIVALDCLSEYEDRRFPYASNIAAIHIETSQSCKLNEITLYHIMISVLLETLRYRYVEKLLKAYQNAELISDDALLLSRPPEFCDLDKMINYNNEHYTCNKQIVVYPEPILYDEELEYFKKLGIKAYTPINYNAIQLNGLNIGISISETDNTELITLGHFKGHLIQLSQDLARYFLAANATLIYGGDLRKGGFTEFIFNEAKILQSRIKKETIHIKNYIAYPIYNKDDCEMTNWKANYVKVVSMIEVEPPIGIKCDKKVFVPPDSISNRYIWSRSLTEMRNKIIDDSNVRICAGGRCYNYKGYMPGVLEEILIAISKKKPIFLLGGFGGITSDVCKLIKNNVMPERLTEEWQIKNNGGYKDLLDFYKKQKDIGNTINYAEIEHLSYDKLHNGLSNEENKRLFDTPFIEEAICLIMKGLKIIKLQQEKD